MVNNNKPFIPPSDDDPFGEYPSYIDLPIPELWDIGEIALPAIHETAESLAKRNTNDDQDASQSLSKRVRAASPDPAMESLPELVQPGIYLHGETPPAPSDEEPIYLTLPDPVHQVDAIAQPILKKAFTPAEDLRIKEGVESGATYDAIAKALNRETVQIRKRWNHYVKHKYPEIHYKPLGAAEISHKYTEEENQRIRQGKEANESNATIAQALNLTPGQVGYHWNKYLSKNYPQVTKKPVEKPEGAPFTPQEEETLLTGIKKRRNWNQLAIHLKRRSHQIEDHWHKELSKNHPGIEYNPVNPTSKSIFNDKTDADIVRLIKARYYYEEIAQELGYETIQITHRWNAKLKSKHPGVNYDPVRLEFRNIPASPQPASVVLLMDPYTYYNWHVQQAAFWHGRPPPF